MTKIDWIVDDLSFEKHCLNILMHNRLSFLQIVKNHVNQFI